MKENPKSKNLSGATRKNGFYVALYSSVGVMLVLAVVIGYNNFATPKSSVKNTTVKSTEAPDLAPVTKDTVEKGQAYLTPADRADDIGTAISGSNPNQSSPAYSQSAESGAQTADAAPAQSADLIESLPTISSTDENIIDANIDNDEISITTDDEETPEQSSSGGRSAAVETPEFTAFDDSGKMEWPVLGDIVMDYSVDHVIYDKTLDQYRINDTLCIAADLGTEVRAAADGMVSSITSTKVDGKRVVIDHGNGWLTTYTQLQDTVPVEVGDVVRKGQAIGSVGDPSIYGVSLGQHLGFSVSKDAKTMNPKDILAAQ